MGIALSVNNPRITKKERGLLKGAIRRVFSRSELRLKVLNSTVITHTDPKRSRVKRWSRCSKCGRIEPTYLIDIDHILPVIPVDRSFEEMTLDEVADRVWCEEKNLAGICETCHNIKTRDETVERRKHKKANKNK